jgi:hypothetical protein
MKIYFFNGDFPFKLKLNFVNFTIRKTKIYFMKYLFIDDYNILTIGFSHFNGYELTLLFL